MRVASEEIDIDTVEQTEVLDRGSRAWPTCSGAEPKIGWVRSVFSGEPGRSLAREVRRWRHKRSRRRPQRAYRRRQNFTSRLRHLVRCGARSRAGPVVWTASAAWTRACVRASDVAA